MAVRSYARAFPDGTSIRLRRQRIAHANTPLQGGADSAPPVRTTSLRQASRCDLRSRSGSRWRREDQAAHRRQSDRRHERRFSSGNESPAPGGRFLRAEGATVAQHNRDACDQASQKRGAEAADRGRRPRGCDLDHVRDRAGEGGLGEAGREIPVAADRRVAAPPWVKTVPVQPGTASVLYTGHADPIMRRELLDEHELTASTRGRPSVQNSGQPPMRRER